MHYVKDHENISFPLNRKILLIFIFITNFRLLLANPIIDLEKKKKKIQPFWNPFSRFIFIFEKYASASILRVNSKLQRM